MRLQESFPEEHALRPKKAAQYGSKFDKAIEKLAKKQNKIKSKYLEQFNNKKLGVLFSSGKDSCYSAYLMKKQGYDLSCLITIKSKNPDSYMYHTPNIHMTELQSKTMDIPLITQTTKGKKEDELKDLEKVLKKAKKEYKITGIITGALFSDYQKERIEKIAEKLSLKIFSPLWHMDQEKEMRELMKNKFEIIFTAIAAEGFDKSLLIKKITNKEIDKLVKINKRVGINVAGEGGEFESLTLDCPLFKKKIKIIDSEIKQENENTAKLIIKKATICRKL
jgi:asparagine synthase (glutamine-hydrolysing)